MFKPVIITVSSQLELTAIVAVLEKAGFAIKKNVCETALPYIERDGHSTIASVGEVGGKEIGWADYGDLYPQVQRVKGVAGLIKWINSGAHRETLRQIVVTRERTIVESVVIDGYDNDDALQRAKLLGNSAFRKINEVSGKYSVQ